MSSKPINDDWPDTIYMSGLPYNLSGYNTSFVKSNKLVNERPTYILKPYKMYFVVPIMGVRIYMAGKKWHMEYLEDQSIEGNVLYKRGTNQDTPFGEWSNGGYLSRME
jgi:hypothetical protein